MRGRSRTFKELLYQKLGLESHNKRRWYLYKIFKGML